MHFSPHLAFVALSAVLVSLSTPMAHAQTAASSATASGANFSQRVTFEAVRNKRSRIEGGDFDDKLDRLSFTLKFANGDPRAAFENLKGEFYVFAGSMVNRKAYQLLGVEKFDLSLAPRANHSIGTEEWVTRWDNTGAKFGTKYDSWVLVVRNSADEVIFKKSSVPSWLPVADVMNKLSRGSFYDRTLKPINQVY